MALIMALSMLCCLLVVSAGAAAPSSWAQDSVSTAISKGLVPAGLQDQYTSPITRQEFCILADVLYTQVSGSPALSDTSIVFTDTTDPAVLRMASVNVVNGVGDGAFSPNSPLTREQAATLIYRLAVALGKPLAESAPTFADNSAISSWAAAAVGQVQASGIMGGVGDNLFSPAGSYTREQSIVTMLRLFEQITSAAGDTTTATTPTAMTVPDSEISRMLNNPSYYKDWYVERMPAKVFHVMPLDDGRLYLQVHAGPDEINTAVTVYTQTNFAVNDYILITGTVVGPYTYETTAHHTLTVANIFASNVELTTKEAVDAAKEAQILAAHGVTINLPAMPITVEEYNYSNELIATYRITAIDVTQKYNEYSNDVTVTASFTGECIARYTNTNTNCQIIWTLKDAEGYKIASGNGYSPILEVGDKFRNVEISIYNLVPNQTYNLGISTSNK